jgi:nucleoid-associated protein YgaU
MKKSKALPARAVTTVAATVGTAAVLAATFATPADAATARRFAVWDRVANCESSGDWHINTGNGYYGGLQFSASTWAGYHGHRYARQASGATRMEQIQVARRVLAAQGPDAWPVCGPRAGLSHHTGRASRKALPRVAGSHPRPHRPRPHHGHRTDRAQPARHAHAVRHAHQGTYRVRPGDTLTTIARRHHVAGGWRALYRANRTHVHNPDVLHVGQLLVLP